MADANDRYSAFRDIAHRFSLDAVALVPGANFSRLYQAEFFQNERPLVVVIPHRGEPVAIVPSLESDSFSKLAFEGRVLLWNDHNGYQEAFNQLVRVLPIQRIGVEGQVMRVFIDQALRTASPGLDIVDMQRQISSLRRCKTPDEIESIKQAVRVTESALAQTIDQVKAGMTEASVRRILVQCLFDLGADDFAFHPIVAAGTHSALPHASSRDDYPIESGDALLIDCGARVNGLCADITRTFFVDCVSDEHRAIYNTVLAANLAGIKAAQPGASAHDVDDAATVILEQSLYSNAISHKTGHGLGRDIHEDPYIMRGNDDVLKAGMVFTVEPGLYDQTRLGVRIEDDILITETGNELLTAFDKSLTIIG